MLQGEKVCLRAIERSDLPQLLQWRNQPEFRRYFREYRELGKEHQNEWYERIVLNDNRTRMFAIVERNSERLLGACGICYIDWVNRNADFSIYIGVDGLYIDNIFAPDAARTMIRFAFDELNLHRLWAEIYDFDTPKTHFFQELSFTQEGRHRQTHWSEGRWCDSLFFSLLRTDKCSIP